MTPGRRDLALATKGFMPADEGDALWDAAVAAGRAVPGAPMLEVGSYCGRSTIWLGDAAESVGVVLFAVDHHRVVKIAPDRLGRFEDGAEVDPGIEALELLARGHHAQLDRARRFQLARRFGSRDPFLDQPFAQALAIRPSER